MTVDSLGIFRRIRGRAIPRGLCDAAVTVVRSRCKQSESRLRRRHRRINKQLGTVYLRQGNLGAREGKAGARREVQPARPRAAQRARRAVRTARQPQGSGQALRGCGPAGAEGSADLQQLRGLPLSQQPHRRRREALSRLGTQSALSHAGGRLDQRGRVPAQGEALRRSERQSSSARCRSGRISRRPSSSGPISRSSAASCSRRASRSTNISLRSMRPPTCLLVGVRVSRAQGDRVAEEKYTRRLRVEFPGSQQLKSLSASPSRNPG